MDSEEHGDFEGVESGMEPEEEMGRKKRRRRKRTGSTGCGWRSVCTPWSSWRSMPSGLSPTSSSRGSSTRRLPRGKRKARQAPDRMKPAKRNKDDDVFGAQFDEILESMAHLPRSRSGELLL